MNRIISVLVLLCVVVITSTAQQFTVQGLVLDSILKQAVDGAVVRVFEGERMLGFDITNTKGEYKIQLNSSSASLLLAFQHLAFNVKSVKRAQQPQQTHALKVQFNPVEKWFVYVGFDYNRFEFSPGRYITMQFMDAGVRYKNKKSEIELKLNNLLNTREYAYTVFSDLDSFSYRYQLNPVSAIVLWKFRI